MAPSVFLAFLYKSSVVHPVARVEKVAWFSKLGVVALCWASTYMHRWQAPENFCLYLSRAELETKGTILRSLGRVAIWGRKTAPLSQVLKTTELPEKPIPSV